MSKRTTLVLMALLVGLLAGSWAISEWQRVTQKPVSPGSPPWLELDTEQIWSITITGEQRLEAVRDATGGWVLQSPVTGTADGPKLTAWLNQWRYSYVQRTLTPTLGLEEFGLRPPMLVITLTAQSGIETVIHVGQRVPAVSGYYARRPGEEQVVVIGTWPIEEALKLVATPPLAPTPTPAPLLPQGPLPPEPAGTP